MENRYAKKVEKSCEIMRKTKKHKQDGKAHDVVFITNCFFCNKNIFFFSFFLVFGFSLLPEKVDKQQKKTHKTKCGP